MKAYTHEVDQREVILDLNIRLVKQTSPSCYCCSNHVLALKQESSGCAVIYLSPALCSLHSYKGDVDIDAVVKEPITAGVKGLKVAPFYF